MPARVPLPARRARQALEEAREKTAAILDAHPDEVIFTSGGTEANNLALFGLIGEPPAHIITSPIEHPSVVSLCGLWIPDRRRSVAREIGCQAGRRLQV